MLAKAVSLTVCLSSFYTLSLSPASSSLHRDAVILQGFEEESERFFSKLHGFGARTLQYGPNAHQATAQHISVGVYKLINEIKSIISSKNGQFSKTIIIRIKSIRSLLIVLSHSISS